MVIDDAKSFRRWTSLICGELVPERDVRKYCQTREQRQRRWLQFSMHKLKDVKRWLIASSLFLPRVSKIKTSRNRVHVSLGGSYTYVGPLSSLVHARVLRNRMWKTTNNGSRKNIKVIPRIRSWEKRGKKEKKAAANLVFRVPKYTSNYNRSYNLMTKEIL